MSTPYAKIVVFPHPGVHEYGKWRLAIETDMDQLRTVHPECFDNKRFVLAHARAWSRRLGNIPVEVQE